MNAVSTKDYLARIAEDRLATAKGYLLTEEDRFRAEIIERVMCDMAVDLSETSRRHGLDPRFAVVDRSRIESLIEDGVVVIDDGWLSVAVGAGFLVRSVAWLRRAGPHSRLRSILSAHATFKFVTCSAWPAHRSQTKRPSRNPPIGWNRSTKDALSRVQINSNRSCTGYAWEILGAVFFRIVR